MANAQFNSNMSALAPAFSTPLSFPPGTNIPPYYPMPPAWSPSVVQPPNWAQQAFSFAANPPAHNHHAQHQPAYGLPRLDTNPQQQFNVPPSAEEGELSEGEFFHIRAGRTGGTSSARATRNISGPQAAPKGSQSAWADPSGSKYNTSVRGSKHRKSAGSAVRANGLRADQLLDRHGQDFQSPHNNQSDSYSPHGSPRQRNSGPRANRPNGSQAYANKTPSTELAKDAHQSSQGSHQTCQGTKNNPAAMEIEQEAILKAPENNVVENLEIPDDDRYSPQLGRPATPKKPVIAQLAQQAQHAILNLMPAKVQFQDYIEEGIDEGLMHELFESLGMPQTRRKAVQGVLPSMSVPRKDVSGHTNRQIESSTAQSTQARSRDLSNSLPNEPSTTGISIRDDQSMVNGEQGLKEKDFPPVISPTHRKNVPGPAAPNGEEENDRDARLLSERVPAEKAAAEKVAASAKAAALKAEKDRQLSIKLENLRKSREARALKNDTAKKNPLTPVTPIAAAPKFTEATPVSPAQPATLATQQATQQATRTNIVTASSVSPVTIPKQSGNVNMKNSSGTTAPLVLPVLKDTVPLRPAIPGLTLTATTATPSTSASPLPPVPAVQQRKRPVAADFAEPSPPNAFKRPFGQSRVDKPLVIDVSEDEDSDGDEDSAMDIDRPESSQGPTIPTSKTGPITRIPAHASDQDTWKPRVPTGTSLRSTPTPRSNPKPSPDVRSIESKIAELQKQIAEKEAKRKAKASVNRSGSQTPLSAEAIIAQQNVVREAIAEKAQISAELERLLEKSKGSAASEIQKLAHATAKEQEKVEQTKIAGIKKRHADGRRKRRSDIESTLPTVNAEVEKAQQKLKLLRQEAAQQEAAIQKYLEDKQKLEKEMAELGDEPDEQPEIEQTQLVTQETRSNRATPQRISDPAPEDNIPDTSFSITKSPSYPPQIGVAQDKQDPPTKPNSSQQSQDVDMLDDVAPHEEQNGTIDEHTNSPEQPAPSKFEDQQRTTQSGATHPVSPVEDDEANSSNGKQISSEISYTQFTMNASADRDLEAALQQASAQAEAEYNANPDIDMAGTHAQDPNQLQPDPSPSPHAAQNGRQSSSSAFGREGQNQERLVEDDSDAYEPPEASPPTGGELSPRDPFASSPAPHASVEKFSANDTSAISATNLQTIDIIEPRGSTSSEMSRDLQIAGTEKEGEEDAGVSKPKTFKPYQSPLKQFSSYRFNTNFSDQVPGGYRSTTYSHCIDPEKEFCRFELGGGICNDTTCEFQHFKDLSLGDDIILLQLGDPEAFNNKPDVKDSFIKGLRNVLQDLRARKIRDFPTIASEIAAFRNKFDSEKFVL